MALLNSIIYFLIVIFILLSIWSFVLKLRKAEQNKKKVEQPIKKQNIKKIRDAKKLLYEINKLARKFFKEYLNLDNELTYQELSQILRNKKENRMADFCDRLEYYLYSGDKRNIEETKILLEQFKSITLDVEARSKTESKN